MARNWIFIIAFGFLVTAPVQANAADCTPIDMADYLSRDVSKSKFKKACGGSELGDCSAGDVWRHFRALPEGNAGDKMQVIAANRCNVTTPISTEMPAMEHSEGPWTVFFDEGTAKLGKAARVVLTQAVTDAKKIGLKNFVITGHADTYETHTTGKQLSLARAAAAKAFMVNLGIGYQDFKISGVGADQLMTETGPKTKEPLNRRVVIEAK